MLLRNILSTAKILIGLLVRICKLGIRRFEIEVGGGGEVDGNQGEMVLSFKTNNILKENNFFFQFSDGPIYPRSVITDS